MHRSIGTSPETATFSPGVEVVAPTRWLSISGQVPRDADGRIPEGIEAQSEIVWAKIAEVLAGARMGMQNLVDMTVYLVHREDGAVFDQVRSRWLEGHKPASTKIIVAALVDRRMLCEVQANAAE